MKSVKLQVGLLSVGLLALWQLSTVTAQESSEFAGQLVRPNCTSPSEATICNIICGHEADCIELLSSSGSQSTSACLCKNTPVSSGDFVCEKGDKDPEELVFSNNPSHMELCHKLTQAFPSVDYYSCSPRVRPMTFICAANDGSNKHSIKKRALNIDLKCPDDPQDFVDYLLCFAQALIDTINKVVESIVQLLTDILNEIRAILSKLPSLLNSVVEGISVDGRRRRREIA